MDKYLQQRSRERTNLKFAHRTLSAELRDHFSVNEIKAEVHWWKQFLDYIQGLSSRNTSFNQLCGLCLMQPKEQKLLLKFRRTGLRRMKDFLMISTRKEIQSKNLKLLSWSCLSLVSFYCLRHQTMPNECKCFGTTKMQDSKVLFRSAMYLILPEKQDEVIKHVIRYVTLTELWNTEDFDTFVFQELLTMITKPELLVAKIIKQIEKSQKDEAVRQSLNIACSLSSILEHAYWDKYLFNHLLHNCFNTLLKVYLLCNDPVPSVLKLDNSKFRMVIKTSIKYFISNIKDNKGLVSVMDSIAKCLLDSTIVAEDRIEVTEMISFCAQHHQTKFFRESITPDMLDLMLFNLHGTDKNLAMLSHKILHNLFDRHGNIKYFSEPVYYFKGRSEFTINFNYGLEDIHFFKSFSKRFFDRIHYSFMYFNDKYSLITCYVTLCLILLEVPEPVITINVIHVAITVQNDVLKADNDELTLTGKFQIHAIVSSLLSLICLIHQEEVTSLKKYVDEVVMFRTENSPHLLPPLQNKYSVATHHTTSYHDQLYFLEEEVIYALQRCWLARRTGPGPTLTANFAGRIEHSTIRNKI